MLWRNSIGHAIEKNIYIQILRYIHQWTHGHVILKHRKERSPPFQKYAISPLILFIAGADTALLPPIQHFRNHSGLMWVLRANHTHRLHTAADFLWPDILLIATRVFWQMEPHKQLNAVPRGTMRKDMAWFSWATVVGNIIECMQMMESTFRIGVQQADPCS